MGRTDQGVTLVDANVLFDVLDDDPQWAEWSATAIEAAEDGGHLAINPLILAEICGGLDSLEAAYLALPPDRFRREPLPWDAAFLAGRAFVQYRRRGSAKRSALPDFYIGAHAEVSGFRLLTRDATRYRTYFPTVDLVTP